jgi:serine/threonine-protein kinase
LKGLSEYRLGRPERAIPLLQASAPKLPDRAGPGLVLAMARYQSGSAKEARKTMAAAVRNYNWDKSWADHTSGWVSNVLRREAERMILPDLPAFLEGTYQPQNNDERLAMLGVCQFEGRWSKAARLYTEAFEADPKLAEGQYAQDHYAAACFAALAGSGSGKDGTHAGELECAHWRKQARDWLRADLASIEKLLGSNVPNSRQYVQSTLPRWAATSDLAGLRDPAELEKLPPCERQECRSLWSDQDALLRRAADSK